MAEWLRRGLQILVRGFDSLRGLQLSDCRLGRRIRDEILPVPAPHVVARQSSRVVGALKTRAVARTDARETRACLSAPRLREPCVFAIDPRQPASFGAGRPDRRLDRAAPGAGPGVEGRRHPMLDYAQARRLMVDCQLRTFDVNDVAVLDAFDEVPRERFVPPGREDFAYIDQALRLGRPGRAMPAPMLLARMVQALAIEPGNRALDAAHRLRLRRGDPGPPRRRGHRPRIRSRPGGGRRASVSPTASGSRSSKDRSRPAPRRAHPTMRSWSTAGSRCGRRPSSTSWRTAGASSA